MKTGKVEFFFTLIYYAFLRSGIFSQYHGVRISKCFLTYLFLIFLIFATLSRPRLTKFEEKQLNFRLTDLHFQIMWICS